MTWDCCSICARYGSGSCEDNVVFNYGEEYEMLVPRPNCPTGYPESQLRKTFTPEQFKAFMHWMIGQTFSSCDGRVLDREAGKMVDSECAGNPHGFVYYVHDVRDFLAGKPVTD